MQCDTCVAWFIRHSDIALPQCIPLYNYSGRLEGGLGGDALGVQGVDVLASWQYKGVPDGVPSWARLNITSIQSLQKPHQGETLAGK